MVIECVTTRQIVYGFLLVLFSNFVPKMHRYLRYRTFKMPRPCDVAIECVLYFGCAVQETLWRRKSKFVMKIKYKTTSNLLYHAV